MSIRYLAAILILYFCLMTDTLAQSTYNTYGTLPGVAIDGYDTVAYFSEKKATKGSEQYTYDWAGAKWHFATEANRIAFAGDPEKFAPQYGGYCALNIAYGAISRKPVSADFEVYRGKLYLFGEATANMTPKKNWWQSGPVKNIRDADTEWPKLKKTLE